MPTRQMVYSIGIVEAYVATKMIIFFDKMII